MSYKETKIYSVLAAKCPVCHEGDFYETSNPYKLKKFDKMHKNCPVCNADFEQETGFYYGAMFVSYGLTVAFGLSTFAVMCLVFNFDEIQFLFTFAALQFICMPIFYRLSRLIWINIFVDYKGLR
jgi:uncharacterized protein (DUF983 family)